MLPLGNGLKWLTKVGVGCGGQVCEHERVAGAAVRVPRGRGQRRRRSDFHHPSFTYRRRAAYSQTEYECILRSLRSCWLGCGVTGRLTCSLTPVFRRPDVNETTGAALPTYELTDLKCGESLLESQVWRGQ